MRKISRKVRKLERPKPKKKVTFYHNGYPYYEGEHLVIDRLKMREGKPKESYTERWERRERLVKELEEDLRREGRL